MKKTVLFGAGQVGAAVARLLAGEYVPVCFADNSADKRGVIYAELPVLSVDDAIRTEPSCVCICALGADRVAEMEAQLRSAGFDKEVLYASQLAAFDARTATMRLLATELDHREVAGDIAELGVYRGEFAALMNAAFPKRKLHLFDTFSGFDDRDLNIERQSGFLRSLPGDFSKTSETQVLERMSHPEVVTIHKGFFPDTFALCGKTTFAFVSIDADLYAPTKASLPLFWDALSPGGAIMVHDYNSEQYPGTGKALREFCLLRNIYPVPLSDLHGSAVLIKQGDRI